MNLYIENLQEILGPWIQTPQYLPILFAITVCYMFWFRRSLIKRNQELLSRKTQEELDEIIQAWNPEPLVPEYQQDHYALHPKIISSMYGKHIIVDGHKCLNLATHNYLGLAEDQDCIEEAVNAVKIYGVGSCGPRGFFGTVDIHLKLEEEIARFMQTEEAILYSYGYAAISSAIPAYSKINDVIFVDEEVSFAIQQGLIASRSHIKFFKHNDMNDLERLLKEQHEFDLKNPKAAQKISRFMVVEGLYINTGDICPLARIIELKRKYKVRLFIDDTCAFGVLGSKGRGIVEHTGCNLDDVDMIAASLEFACASYGGFCTGTRFVIDHQRLSGLGYCFSASLPPLQAAYAFRAIQKIQENPGQIAKLRDTCIHIHQLMTEHSQLITVSGLDYSPIKHLHFTEPMGKWLERRKNKDKIDVSSEDSDSKTFSLHEYDKLRLEKVVDYAFSKGYALTVARYLERAEHKLPKPSIRLIVSVLLDHDELNLIVSVLVEAFQAVQAQFYKGDF